MTEASVEVRGWIGRPLPRFEDERFTTGTAQFVDDLRLPEMLHAAFVRSPYAHARLTNVDVTAARAAPGVVAVLTGGAIAARMGTFSVTPTTPDVEVVEVMHPILALERVRYVGEPVAVVVATTPEAAADAAELVWPEVEELPAVVEPGDSDVTLHEAAPDNVLLRWQRIAGEPERAFDRAHATVRQRLRMPRLIAAPLEPRGALATYDRDADLLTICISAQDQHRQLANLARVLQRAPDRLRVVVPDVGGAFGSKGVPAPETAAVALCALELERPVKWIETRTESSLATYQGRGAEIDAELALDEDGRMLALRARYLADLGAYLYPTTVVPALTGARLLPGCCDIPSVDVAVRGVATTKVPTGPYRGAGRPEAAYAIERLVDIAAAELGLDPVEMLPLEAEARFELPGPAFSSGAYVAVVEVERETGEVRLDRLAAVDDCGRVVNPLLAEGQVIGATVQAIGECLYEQTGWNEEGQPLAVNLYDYHLPTAFSVPPIANELRETLSPLNPLGAKGIGEGGSIGTPAAIANAVVDALRPLGIRHLDPPFTPARVWTALHAARSGGG